MTVNQVIKGAVPVIIGVFLAGFLMNAMRDVDFVRQAIDGFDS